MGEVGRHLAVTLSREGHSVRAVDRSPHSLSLATEHAAESAHQQASPCSKQCLHALLQSMPQKGRGVYYSIRGVATPYQGGPICSIRGVLTPLRGGPICSIRGVLSPL